MLVLDEADRLLEMGFQEEVGEVVRAAPRGRQTMLFSATFNDEVGGWAGWGVPRAVAWYVIASVW